MGATFGCDDAPSAPELRDAPEFMATDVALIRSQRVQDKSSSSRDVHKQEYEVTKGEVVMKQAEVQETNSDGPVMQGILRPQQAGNHWKHDRQTKRQETSDSGFVVEHRESRHVTLDVSKSKRIEVAESNYRLRNNFGRVPTTLPFSYRQVELQEAEVLCGEAGDMPRVKFSGWSTADALLFLGRTPNVQVCGLNFANGSHVGGGYKNGAVAQEEDLCRRLPTLYTSLHNAKREGHYPFGPSTCSSSSAPAKYSDVLYTAGLVVARLGEGKDYSLLPRHQQATVSLITAAAPNVNFGNDIYELDLMYHTVRSIFITPKIFMPETSALVLGAWGCGAFGGNPEDVALLFAKALLHEGLGRLYSEVHFAIPESEKDVNAATFRSCLQQQGIPFQELGALPELV